MSRSRRGVLALLLAAAVPAHADEPWPVAFGGPFTLTDHTGHRRSDADFHGSWLLVQFGYTSCPDICPLSLDTMAAALEALGPAASRVQPLFVTVDPARDSPAVLASFVVGFDPRLIGLTGSEAEITAIAKSYRVHRRKIVTDPADPAAYLVDHGSFTYLMGPDGGFLTLIPYGTDSTRMARTIADYLRR